MERTTHDADFGCLLHQVLEGRYRIDEGKPKGFDFIRFHRRKQVQTSLFTNRSQYSGGEGIFDVSL
jgi:RNA recognition motif-containing protein